MSEFIEVHDLQGDPILVNTAHLELVRVLDDTTFVFFANDIPDAERGMKVQETYEQVQEKILPTGGMTDTQIEALCCCWSIMPDDVKAQMRQTYPALAKAAEEIYHGRGYMSADEAQDIAIREATEEVETDEE